MMVQQNRPELT